MSELAEDFMNRLMECNDKEKYTSHIITVNGKDYVYRLNPLLGNNRGFVKLFEQALLKAIYEEDNERYRRKLKNKVNNKMMQLNRQVIETNKSFNNLKKSMDNFAVYSMYTMLNFGLNDYDFELKRIGNDCVKIISKERFPDNKVNFIKGIYHNFNLSINEYCTCYIYTLTKK